MSSGGKKTFSDLDLMLYADGELPDDEAREVSAHLAGDESARLKLDSLRQTGEAVRTYTELETDRAEVEVPAFAEMWQRIERRIHANGSPVERAAVRDASLPEAGGRRRESGDRRASVAGRWASFRGWFDDHIGHVLTGAVSAGVACALMLAVGPRLKVIEKVHDSAPVVITPAVLRSQPPEVEHLEVYEGSGTVLTIAPDADDDSAAAVIWISSDEEQNREGPL
jgi:anti-sigma factor RsiW